MTLHWLDIGVLAFYFLGIVAFGLWVARKKNKNTDEYFLGGRSFPGWAVGISLLGTMISSLTFLAYPADAFKTAWMRFAPNLLFPVMALIAAYFFIPFFRRGTITSAYQYLSLRFGSGISAYTASIFLLSQLMRTATITYLLALLMATLLPISVEGCILIAGGFTAVYAVKGGFEAVIWTEVVQTAVLIIGAIVSIVLIVYHIPGGLPQIFKEAFAAGKISFMDLDVATNTLVPTGYHLSIFEKTVPMLMILGFFMHLTAKLDQTTVQRWCSARTAKDARKSMWILAIFSLPIWGGFMFLGTCLWVYFQHNPCSFSEEILSGARKAEEILPYFIVNMLPPGVSGLVVAGALAASMSALAGSISASSMVCVHDIYRPFLVKMASDRHYLIMGKLASLGIALLMMFFAYLFYHADSKTFSDLGLIVTALVGGGTASIFLLGMFTRVGDSRAVFVGILCTLLFTIWAMFMQFGLLEVKFDLYYTALIGNVIMFATSYAAGILIKPKQRNLTNLTVWDKSNDTLV